MDAVLPLHHRLGMGLRLCTIMMIHCIKGVPLVAVMVDSPSSTWILGGLFFHGWAGTPMSLLLRAQALGTMTTAIFITQTQQGLPTVGL
jgi:hypothetical protein